MDGLPPDDPDDPDPPGQADAPVEFDGPMNMVGLFGLVAGASLIPGQMARPVVVVQRVEKTEHLDVDALADALIARMKPAVRKLLDHLVSALRRPSQPSLGLVSEDKAARLFPMRREDARTWLRHEGLVKTISGRRVVSLAALQERFDPRTTSLDAPEAGSKTRRSARTSRSTSTRIKAKPGRLD